MKLCKDCKHYKKMGVFHKCLREPPFVKTDLVTGEEKITQPTLDCRFERGGVGFYSYDGKDYCGEYGVYFTPR